MLHNIFRFATWFVVMSMPFLSLQASETILIAVASNFQLPAKALAREYSNKTGHEVRISSGSTGKLYAQIINGAPYAIFFAGNSREPSRLEQEGKAVSSSRFTYALGKLVLWSGDAKLLVQDPKKLLQEGRFKSLSLANPQTAPYGEAGMEVLDTLKPDAKNYRIIRAENVTQSFQYAATGATEICFIAYSQLLTAPEPDKGSYWLVPKKLYHPIQQQVVLLNAGADNAVAKDFLLFIKSTKGKQMITAFGYDVEK